MTSRARTKRRPRGDGAETIGERLARLRHSRGYSQAELAARVGTIQRTVSSYECGRLRLPADMVARLAKALHVSADQIVGIEKVEAHAEEPLPRRLQQRMKRIAQLPAAKQRALITTIDAFVRGPR